MKNKCFPVPPSPSGFTFLLVWIGGSAYCIVSHRPSSKDDVFALAKIWPSLKIGLRKNNWFGLGGWVVVEGRGRVGAGGGVVGGFVVN